MKLRLPFLILGLAFALLLKPSDAIAGKGVKKTAEQIHHGVVMSAAAGKVTIKTNQHHKKKKLGVVGTPVKHHEATFSTSSATKVEIATRGQFHPATLRALHKGKHVSISAKKHQADKIVIHHHHKKKKRK